MRDKKFAINSLQAAFCAAIGDPHRVKIIYELANAPQNVKNLSKLLGISSSATSRHLKILRDKELVNAQRHGHSVEYSLAAPELVDALDILINILNKQLEHHANLVQMERDNEGK